MRVNRKKRMRESSATPLTSISVIQSKGSSCQRRTPFFCRKSERNNTPRSATHPLCITNQSLPLPLHQCSITAATASGHQTTRTPLTGPPFQSEALPLQLSRHQNIIYRYIDQKKTYQPLPTIKTMAFTSTPNFSPFRVQRRKKKGGTSTPSYICQSRTPAYLLFLRLYDDH